jgi:hypothetical protein
VVLAIGGAGGVSTLLWPFFPHLLELVPLGAVVALGAWMLVVTRLRNSGPEEFLEAVAEEIEGGSDGDSDGD